MDKESKELLLKDLCARLPYELYFKLEVDGKSTNKILTPEWIRDIKYHPQYFKPYLRPMSSMMEEEKLQLVQYACIGEDMNGEFIDEVERKNCHNYIDWLNEHHFDYRGLIEKGLALEAPSNMYK